MVASSMAEDNVAKTHDGTTPAPVDGALKPLTEIPAADVERRPFRPEDETGELRLSPESQRLLDEIGYY